MSPGPEPYFAHVNTAFFLQIRTMALSPFSLFFFSQKEVELAASERALGLKTNISLI